MLERVLSWALALTLAALLLAIALQALVGPSPNSVFGLMALRSGVSLFDPIGRITVSLLQIGAVLLLLGPRTRPAGAVLALVLALCAIGMHFSPWLGVNLPLAEQASAALAAGASLDQIAALPTDHGAMFLLALAVAVLAVAVAFVERASGRVQVAGDPRPVGASWSANGSAGTRG